MAESNRAPVAVTVCASTDAVQHQAVVALSEGGYSVQCVDLAATVADDLEPDADTVLVIELGAEPAGLGLVQALRVRPPTSVLSLVVIPTVESVRLTAQAHGNVHERLSLALREERVAAAIEGARELQCAAMRLQAQGISDRPAVRQAVDLLVAAEPPVLLDWLQTVRTETEFARHPALSDETILDQLPQIVHGLLLMARHDEPADLLAENEPLMGLIQKHARGHFEHGVPPEPIVREYQVLSGHLAAYLRKQMTAEAVLRAMDELSALVAAAIRLTVSECIRLSQRAEMPPQAP